MQDQGAFMTIANGPWAAYQPTAQDPWDLGKVAHLHRRAGFSASWSELQRDLRAGPEASVQRLLQPPELVEDEQQFLTGLRESVLANNNREQLKAWWLYRIVFLPRPLEEKMVLFWHSHFATSIRKVDNIALMLEQNELLRRHALGELAPLLAGICADPAMLVWLDGGNSRREQPNENFAREFLELFTLGVGHYNEADIRTSARAFTGWMRAEGRPAFGATPRFRFEVSQFDDGEKTFLRRTGRWNAADIVRITLEQPAAAEFLCRKLYRFLVSEAGEPSADLLRPLAEELRNHRYSLRHLLGIILRSQHFFAQGNRRQRLQSPVELSAGLLRMLEVPRSQVRLLALAAACDRQGQELFAPPNVRGWVGGRTWLNSTTLLQRTNWCNDVLWGNPAVGMTRFDPAAWARRHNQPPAQAAAALLDLLLQGDLPAPSRELVLRIGRDGQTDSLRRAVQLTLHVPQVQLG
jgi:uncharacterized protein (DUF1800 family)